MPRSRQNILLNFQLKNEASRVNLNKLKEYLNDGHFGIRSICLLSVFSSNWRVNPPR